MSQSVLIAKKEELSRRTASSLTIAAASYREEEGRRFESCRETNLWMKESDNNNTKQPIPVIAGTVDRRRRNDSVKPVVTAAPVGRFQPVTMTEDSHEVSEHKNHEQDDVKRTVSLPCNLEEHPSSSRASPTSIVATTTDPAWHTPTITCCSSVSNASETTARETAIVDLIDTATTNDNITSKPETHHDESHESNENRRIRELELELESAHRELAQLRVSVEEAQSQRSKTLGNLKKRRTELAQALEQRNTLQEKLEESTQHTQQLEDENASLKVGLTKVALTKDTMKLKLRTKDELLKESQKENLALRGQLHQLEQFHSVERELLEHYRRLARHTGYYRWGKPIRHLENQLANNNANGASGDQHSSSGVPSSPSS